HRGKTHVSHMIEMLELVHDELAKIARTDLAPAAGKQLFFDARDGGIHFFGVHRPFAQGKIETAAQLGRVVLDPRSVALDHRRHQQFGPLVSSETAIAGGTAPATPYGVALFGNPRV